MSAGPRYSIVLPSYLGHYPGAAKDRRVKLIRAIDSVLMQSFTSWELWVVADGCQETFDLVKDRYWEDLRIHYSLIEKQRIWSGTVRNRGIANAAGEFIVYIDSDDFWGEQHLEKIEAFMKGEPVDWIFFNDLVWKSKEQKWSARKCSPFIKGQNGTSNVAHRASLGVLWHDTGYEHDWNFIRSLMQSSSNGMIVHDAAQYHVCHIPGGFANAYEI